MSWSIRSPAVLVPPHRARVRPTAEAEQGSARAHDPVSLGELLDLVMIDALVSVAADRRHLVANRRGAQIERGGYLFYPWVTGGKGRFHVGA